MASDIMLIGQITMFGGNFAPRELAFCQNQYIPISENQAFFAVIGTNWGGDGRTNFSLPDLRSRVPVGTGQGPGMSDIRVGYQFGVETIGLEIPHMPAHSHSATFYPTGGGGGSSSVCTGTLNVATDGTDAASASAGSHLSAGPIKAGAFSVNNFYKTGASSFEPLEVDISCTGGAGGITGGSVVVGATGSGLDFSIQQPSLGMPFLIAINGIFPSRN